MNKEITYRCIWCIKDTKTNPCEWCNGNDVVDKNKSHNHHWSRNTWNTVICKICDKIISLEEYLAGKQF